MDVDDIAEAYDVLEGKSLADVLEIAERGERTGELTPEEIRVLSAWLILHAEYEPHCPDDPDDIVDD